MEYKVYGAGSETDMEHMGDATFIFEALRYVVSQNPNLNSCFCECWDRSASGSNPKFTILLSNISKGCGNSELSARLTAESDADLITAEKRIRAENKSR